MHRSAFALLVLALGLSAQTTVLVPAQNRGAGGASWHNKPYGDTNLVYQQWMPSADVGIPHGKTITALGFVKECCHGTITGPLNVAPYAAPAVTFDRTEIRLGAGATQLATTTAASWASGSIPATPCWSASGWMLPGYTSPGPCGGVAVWHTLTTPVVYDATQPLLLEIRHIATSQTWAGTGYLVDRTLALTSQTTIRGFGCAGSAGAVPYLTQQPLVAGAPATITLTNANPQPAAAAIWLGLQFQSVLGQAPGVALSAFAPGTDPSCQLWVDPAVVLPLAGTQLTFAVPANALGAQVGAQAALLDAQVPGSVYLAQGTYGWVTSTANLTGTRYAYFAGDGDMSATASPQPQLSGPFAGADTLLLTYQ